MLADAFPALRESAPGNIQEEALPDLRHLIVVDNTPDAPALERELEGVKCAVDFRETLVWREDSAEGRRVEELERELDKDEVINLQFTR